MFKKTARRGLVASILLPTILFCLSISFGFVNTYQQYRTVDNEIKGIQVIKHLFHSMSDLQRIRGLQRIKASVSSEAIDHEINFLQQDVNQDLNEKGWPELRAYFSIGDDVDSILKQANELFLIHPDSNNSHALFDHYTDLNREIHKLILFTADRSQLILDPELHTYYLMEVAVKQIPDITESISKLRGLGSGILAQKFITEEDRDKYQETVAVGDSLLKKLNHTKVVIRDIAPGISSDIDEEIELYKTEVSAVLKGCFRFPCNLTVSILPEEFFHHMTDIIVGFNGIFADSTELLEKRLNLRLTKYYYELIFMVITSMSTILIIFFISHHYYRQEIKAFNKLERVSTTDPLTGIYNRRLLDELFAREMQRARRDGRGLAFGLMDLDFFKQYNDIYGHQKGDVALQAVAKALKGCMQRGSDYYFRYGGEEFCFFFNAQNQSEVETTVEKIRLAIEKLGLEHIKNRPSGVVTVSIGVVLISEVDAEDLDFMIKAADKQLYIAKDNGRNRFEFITVTDSIPSSENT